MSRIGNIPILIPANVTVEKTKGEVVVSGPKGVVRERLDNLIDFKVEGDQLIVNRKNESKKAKALHGLMRNLIANHIKGVTDGWFKGLELVGVGFRVQGGGERLTLSIGFSHTVEIQAPEEIIFEVRDNTKIKVSGINKQLVGQVAANIRKVKPPDAYKGKGIRYEGEVIRRKPGKAGKAGGVGGK